MKAISLQSGSNGNCIYVEADGIRLLFDAGIAGVQAERRLKIHGRDIRDVDALVISHDHSDHVKYAGVYQRKFGLPIYITEDTLDASLSRHELGRLHTVRHFSAGGAIDFGHVAVKTVRTGHDGADGSAFIVCAGQKRLGILTDLGHVFDGLAEAVISLDAAFIESNYDPQMLSSGPYPAFLKRRIAGPGGHISNIEAAELMADAGAKLKWACLAHLSEQNNNPALALKTHRDVNPGLKVIAASRYTPTGILTI